MRLDQSPVWVSQKAIELRIVLASMAQLMVVQVDESLIKHAVVVEGDPHDESVAACAPLLDGSNQPAVVRGVTHLLGPLTRYVAKEVTQVETKSRKRALKVCVALGLHELLGEGILQR